MQLCAQLNKLVWKMYHVSQMPVYGSLSGYILYVVLNLHFDMLYLDFVHVFFFS